MLNNPIDFKTLKTIVRNVLILNTKTRSDDFILIGEVIKNLGIPIQKCRFKISEVIAHPRLYHYFSILYYKNHSISTPSALTRP